MSHPATKKTDYWSQFALLAAITGGGFILAALISGIPLLMSGNLNELSGLSSKGINEKNISA
jgi:hypothetical protein